MPPALARGTPPRVPGARPRGGTSGPTPGSPTASRTHRGVLPSGHTRSPATAASPAPARRGPRTGTTGPAPGTPPGPPAPAGPPGSPRPRGPAAGPADADASPCAPTPRGCGTGRPPRPSAGIPRCPEGPSSGGTPRGCRDGRESPPAAGREPSRRRNSGSASPAARPETGCTRSAWAFPQLKVPPGQDRWTGRSAIVTLEFAGWQGLVNQPGSRPQPP